MINSHKVIFGIIFVVGVVLALMSNIQTAIGVALCVISYYELRKDNVSVNSVILELEKLVPDIFKQG